MAETAAKLRRESGYAACPNSKKGRPSLSHGTVDLIRQFYESSEYSRIMPGKKDCISVSVNGKKEMVQKILLLCDLKELHAKFCTKYPDTLISRSKFSKLRPLHCVPVSCSGSHNVCVCKIHQNLKLKYQGLNSTLQGVGVTCSISGIADEMRCPDPNDACNMLICESCPGFSPIVNNLRHIFAGKHVEEVNFTQWSCTDR